MPEINRTLNLTGYEKKIASTVPELSRPQVRKTAKRIYWIAQNMQEVFDFYEQLRILGIISDPTAREAVENLEDAA